MATSGSLSLTCQLEFVRGPHAGRRIEVELNHPCIFGRGPNADIRLDDNTVSRCHARLFHQEGALWLVDMDSSNGTFVNSHRVRSEVKVAPGDFFVVGASIIELKRASLPVDPDSDTHADFGAETVKQIIGLEGVTTQPGPKEDEFAETDGLKVGELLPQKWGEDGLELGPEVDSIPGYRLLETLDDAGLGLVFMAQALPETRSRLGLEAELVTVKLLPRHDLSDADLSRRMQGMMAAASLDHAHINHPFDLGWTDHFCYCGSEFTNATSLSSFLQQHGAAPPPRALRLAFEIAEALEHAHRRRVAHGCLTPRSVLLNRIPPARLIDFGLLPLLRGAGLPLEDQEGAVIPYLSPERLTQERVAAVPADIYSFGAVCYEMLSGRPPFPRGDAEQLRDAISNGSPRPLQELAPEVDSRLCELVDWCMDKSPSARPRGLGNVLRTLGILRADLELHPWSVPDEPDEDLRRS